MDFREKTIKSERVFSGKIIKLDYNTVILPDGRQSTREIIRHPGGVGIVAIDDDEKIYMVRQYRAPYDEILLEIPAGKLDPGEDIREAAARELSEETGLSAENMEYIGDFYPSVGYSDEILRMFVAHGLTKGVEHPDEGEFLNIVKMPFSEAVEMCTDGRIKDGKTIAAVLRAEILRRKK